MALCRWGDAVAMVSLGLCGVACVDALPAPPDRDGSAGDDATQGDGTHGSGDDGSGSGHAAIVLTDISDQSPDFEMWPMYGGIFWDDPDMYFPGVGLLDLDGDGTLDLVQPRGDGAEPERRSLRMYQGLGDGAFVETTSVAWDDARNGTTVVGFDYDGDDDMDVFVGVDGGPSVLYRNDGDWTFTDVAAEAGVDGPGDRVFTAAAGDVDADGDLDLYVGQWNADVDDEHGPGTAPNRLYLNQGDGTFTDGTDVAGVECYGHSTLGQGFADFDADGDLDLYVTNDFFPDCYFDNRGDGTFAEVAELVGVHDGALHGMGVGIGDLDGDGRLDVLVTDDGREDSSLGNPVYLNRGGSPPTFASVGIDIGLDALETLGLAWNVCWGVGIVDFDADGDVDVHIGSHFERPEHVWQNRAGAFVEVGAGIDALDDRDVRGTSYGDIDGDGDIDIVVAGRRGVPLQVLRNDTEGGKTITVVPRPLAAAVGATVSVVTDSVSLVSVIQAGSSYMSAGPPSAVLGVGDATSARVEVRFSDGTVRVVDDVAAGDVVTVERG